MLNSDSVLYVVYNSMQYSVTVDTLIMQLDLWRPQLTPHLNAVTSHKPADIPI